MNWDDLKIVAAVRDGGGFAAAGARLGVDPTTVARRLARVEAALGASLFRAVDGQRRPTQEGEALLRHIEAIKTEIAQIGRLRSAEAAPAGRMRLACTPSIADWVIAPGLAAFLKAHPGAELEIEAAETNVEFSRWEADLAIRLSKPAKGAFTIRKLGELRYHLLRPRSLAEEGRAPVVCAYPDRLADAPEMQGLAEHGLTAQARVITSNLRVVRQVVSSGLGAGVLPDFALRELLDDPAIDATPLPFRREAWLLIQPHLKRDPLARLICDWIVERFRDRASPA